MSYFELDFFVAIANDFYCHSVILLILLHALYIIFLILSVNSTMYVCMLYCVCMCVCYVTGLESYSTLRIRHRKFNTKSKSNFL